MLQGPIFLTGFMGTGKSKIGHLLARRLQRNFVDTDQLIEARAGRTISQIFASQGEEAFRRVEHECVVEAAARKGVVVALGGGAITQERIREVIRKAGVLVCLEASVETIFARVSRREDRPLLAGLSQDEKRQKIRRLLAEGKPFYDRADIKIQTSNEQEPKIVVAQLIELLESWYAEHRRGS